MAKSTMLGIAWRRLIGPVLVIALAFGAFQIRFRKEMVDFEVYRQAGLRAAQAAPLYRPDDGHYQFKYLPAFALAMTPNALVDDESARVIWYAFSVALLIMFVRWSARFLPEGNLSFGALIAVIVVFMSKFYLHELTLGQVNVLFGVLLVAALGAFDVEMEIAGGILVALAVFVKPYGIIFAPWLVIAGGRRAFTAFVSVVIAGLLLPVVVYGWHGNVQLLADWYRTVTDTTAPNLIVSDNISFAGMWTKWLGTGAPAGVLSIVSTIAAFALAVWTWTRRGDIVNPNYLEAAQLMVLVPLVSPQGWDYVLLLATPAVALIVDRRKDLGLAWRVAALGAITLMGLSIFDLMGRALYARFMAASIVTVCAIVVFAALARLRHLKSS